MKMVIESSRPIARVAKELGINEGTLGNWVAVYRREQADEEPPPTVTERARLRELERENRERPNSATARVKRARRDPRHSSRNRTSSAGRAAVDLRITRGLLPGRGPASCNDAASYRTDGTHRAGVLR